MHPLYCSRTPEHNDVSLSLHEARNLDRRIELGPAQAAVAVPGGLIRLIRAVRVVATTTRPKLWVATGADGLHQFRLRPRSGFVPSGDPVCAKVSIDIALLVDVLCATAALNEGFVTWAWRCTITVGSRNVLLW